MLKKLKPISLIFWLLVLGLAVPAPLIFADDDDDKDKEEETEEADDEEDDEEAEEDDEDSGGGKKIKIPKRRQTSYRAPSPDKEMFDAEKISLNGSEKQFLCDKLVELASEFPDNKQVTNRMRGHALSIALRLKPEDPNAQHVNTALANGLRFTKKFKSPETTAKDLLESAGFLVDGGSKDDNLCAAYVLDIAARISPDNEDIVKLFTEHTENGNEADWEGVLEGSSSGGFPGRGPDLGEATAELIAAKSGKGSFTRRQTTIKGLVVIQLPNGEHAGQANQLNATALPDDTADGVNIRINQEVGPMMRGSLEEVAKIMQLKHEKSIPSGYKIEIGFADKYTPKDGPSAAVAFTLLLDSLLGDFEIDSKFACTGDISADGNVQKIGGVAAKIRGAARKGCELVSIPVGNSDGLRDVAILEGVLPVLEEQVFAVTKYDEAVAVARTDRSEETQKAIDEFKLIQKVVEQKGESILSNKYVIKKLENVLELAPNHLSAKVILEHSRDELPDNLSLRGSYSALNIATSTVMQQVRSGGSRPVDKEDLDKAFKEMDRVRKQIDKRIMPYFEALYDYCEVASSIDGIDDPESLSKRDKEELKEASKAVETAERKLRNNREIQEEMMD